MPVRELEETDVSEASLQQEMPAELNKGQVKKAGPPPGLLPIDQANSPVLVAAENPDVGTGRIPRKAALKCAEMTKVVAKLEKGKGQYDLATLEEAKGLGDADATDVTVHKIVDPVVDICRGCSKVF